ncbi:SIR2 family protein [Clostridium sp. C1]|uniref:SIR2 family protein n=1 Tax=Clostridium sp. C1 TaxID=1155388 RepID=UPI001BA8AD15|nr:SIR2 family protein [Clostridium sp. C1]QUN11949.1 SIR2 family protein [Clostridium sp. C1]
MHLSRNGKELYKESRDIIKEAMREKQLVLFVGSGVSANSGMPLWPQVIKEITKKLPSDLEEDFLKIPQYYYNSRGKKEYKQLMKQIFRYKEPLETNEIHKKIVKFGVDTVITTNYDNLLEKAYEENGQFIQVFSKDTDLPYKKSGIELIKMHGDFENDNFVLKEEDYLLYGENFKLIETYIKSIIGSKVILFMGYSLNDPDVKHIITWTKQILNKDFQRGYLILTGKDFTSIENDYYRNLGINIIYATELLKINADEKENHQNQLINVLDFILEHNDQSQIDKIYERCMPLSHLNYIMGKYISSRFMKENIFLGFDTIDIKDETNLFLNSLEDSFKEDNTNKDFKINNIKNCLQKSPYNKIVKFETNGNIEIPIKQTLKDTFITMIFNFDFPKIINLKVQNELNLSPGNPDLYLKQAYLHVLLNNPHYAYNCLKIASSFFYKKRNFTWYYISEFNRKYVGKSCVRPFFSKLNTSEKNKIKEEIASIDLDCILETIPNYDEENYDFLNELGSFKVLYTLFTTSFQESVKVSEEAITNYTFYSGTPAYVSMENKIIDYIKYSINNYLMIDNYLEATSIFMLYVRTILSSINVANKNESSIQEERYNIYKKSLTKVDIFILLRYFDQNTLKKLFKEYNINILSLDDEAKKYLDKITINFCNYHKVVKIKGRDVDIFWNYLELLIHVEINKENAKKVLVRLNENIKKNDFLMHRLLICNFILKLYDYKLIDDDDIQKEVNLLVANIFNELRNDPDDYFEYKNILRYSLFILKDYTKFDDINEVSFMIKNKKYEMLIDIYDVVGTNIQSSIKSIICLNDVADKYILYAEAVMKEILHPDENIEKEALKNIEQKYLRLKNKEVICTFIPESDSLYDSFLKLFLNNLLIDKEKFISISKKTKNKFYEWITNIKDFDYSLFDLEWLSRCSESLCKKIAEDSITKEKIVHIYKEYHLAHNITPQTTYLFIKYFI